MKGNSFFLQIRQEARRILCVSSILLIAVGAPLFYGLFYAYPYTEEVPRKVPIAVIDYDQSGMSRSFLRMLISAENVNIAARPQSTLEARALFSSWDVYAIVMIPKGFQENLLKGMPAEISFYSDGSYLIYYRQTAAAVQAVAFTMGAGVAIQRLEAAGVPDSIAMQGRTSVNLNNYGLFNPAGGYATYVLPAVFLLICHQLAIIIIAMSMAHAYSTGTVPRSKPFTELQAKVVVFMFMMIMHTLFMFSVVLHLFKVPFVGHLSDLILFMMPFYLSVIFIGIIFGSFCRVPETTVIYIAVTSIPLLFISGYSWSWRSMPDFLQIFRLILPSTHGIEGVVRIYRQGATLMDMREPVLYLWALAFILFFIAWYRLRVRSHELQAGHNA